MPGRNRAKRDALGPAIEWLCLAQDQSSCGGVCGIYDFFNGWSGPYPETTGYIVPTFLQASAQLDRPELAERAKRMLDWLVETQLPCGAFPGGISSDGQRADPRVFNTGQIILGLLAGFRYFRSDNYMASAIQAADWLCNVQDSDGAWRTGSYGGFPHAYHTRVAWPLIDLGLETGRAGYVQAAERNLAWALRQQAPDGWFNSVEMVSGEPAQLHPIAYTLRGMWESGVMLNDDRYLDAVVFGTERLLHHAETGRLAGAYESDWGRAGHHLCLTGHAQMACLWMRMYQVNKDTRLVDAAMKVCDLLCQVQDLDNASDALRGGLRGSYPMTGSYLPLSIINWGTKFIVDALLLKRSCLDRNDTPPQEPPYPIGRTKAGAKRAEPLVTTGG